MTVNSHSVEYSIRVVVLHLVVIVRANKNSLTRQIWPAGRMFSSPDLE